MTGFETSIKPQPPIVPVKPEAAQHDQKNKERDILSAIVTYRDIGWNDAQILEKLLLMRLTRKTDL